MARKKKPEEHVNHERWLVSYADFITLLFAFFTTLYAISTVDKTKAGKMVYSMKSAFNVEIFKTPSEYMAYQGVASPAIVLPGAPGIGNEGGPRSHEGDPNNDDDEIGRVAKEINGIIQDPSMKERVSVNVDERGLVVSLSEAGNFQSGQADMDDKARQAIDAVLSKVADKKCRMTIEGHTDNRPIRGGKFKDNWALSSERARVVLDYAEKHGIESSRLSASGHGDNNPMGDNTTDEGRAKNRRVDIVILKGTCGAGAEAPAGKAAGAKERAAEPAKAEHAQPSKEAAEPAKHGKE